MQTLPVTPEQRETGYRVVAEGIKPVAAHKTRLLSIKMLARMKTAEMGVERLSRRGTPAEDSGSSVHSSRGLTAQL